MIVTCERCATQFQLDDERVPDEGVRVRCSRCKHAFFIERPARTEAEMIHRVAHRALDDQETPEVARDLPAEDGAPSFGGHAGIGSSAGESGPRESDEDDWQFNLDGSQDDGSEGAPDPGGVEAADELLATEDDFDADDEPFDVAAEDAAAGWDEAPLLHDSDAEAPSGLDLSDDAPAASLAQIETEEDPETEEHPWEQMAPAAEARAEPAPEVPEIRSAEPSEALQGPTSILVDRDPDELGGPDEWDLFADGTPEEEGPSASRSQSLSLGAVPGAPRLRVSPRSNERVRSLPRGLQRAGRAVGWLVALGLFGFGLHGGLAGAGRQVATASTAVEIGPVRLHSVSGQWIENLVAGPLFVVSGAFEATGPGTPPRLLVELLDASGRRLESRRVFVGPALSARVLREEDPRSLQRLQESRSLSEKPPTAGESRRFHAIVTGVPLEASWFRFAPASARDNPALPSSEATAAAPVASPEPAVGPRLSASAPR